MKKIIFRILLQLVFYFVPAGALTGQQLLFENLGKTIPFPSMECYNVIQDREGYIWISTESGLCRYNGTALKVYNKSNGLPEKGCYVLTQDRTGQIWLVTTNNRILRVEGDSLVETAFSKPFVDLQRAKIDFTYALEFLGDSVLLLHGNKRITRVRTRAAQCDTLTGPSDGQTMYYFEYRGNDYEHLKTPLYNTAAGKTLINKTGHIGVLIRNGNRTLQLRLPYSENATPDWRVLTATDQLGNSYLSVHNYIICVKPDLQYTLMKMPQITCALRVDAENSLWIGSYKNGLYYYPDPGDTSFCIRSLAGYSVAGICEDHEGGVWCTTLENGVFYSQSKHIISYGNYPGFGNVADMLKIVDGTVFISSHPNEIACIRNNHITRKSFPLKRPYVFKDIIADGANWYIGGKDATFRTDSAFRNIEFLNYDDQLRNLPQAASFARSADGTIWSAQFGAVNKIAGNKATLLADNLPNTGSYIYPYSAEWLLYCGRKGLLKINAATGAWSWVPGISSGTGKIVRTASGRLLIASKLEGLMELVGDSVQHVYDPVALGTDEVLDILEAPDKNIWVSTQNGLLRFSSPDGKTPFITYTTSNGLPANKITHLQTDGTYLYCNSTEGIFRFPLKEELLNEAPVRFYLRQAKAGDKVLHLSGDNSTVLDYADNHLSLQFDLLTFKDRKNVWLKYKLVGEDSLVRRQLSDVIELNNLAPGNYELEVSVQSGDRISNTVPLVFSFTISKPFWKRQWFLILLSAAMTSLIFLGFRIVLRRVRRKEKEQTRINAMIAEYRLSALQAQMNPHFIFNVINSIQTYILEQETQIAYDYLAKFSKLMRLVLNHAREKTHTLESELEMLRMYLDLEQLRFGKRFIYEVQIDPGMNTHEVRVLPMLFQPYVENAIWHGLLPLKNERKGKLKIEVKRSGENIVAVIEDNGIGRSRSAGSRTDNTRHQPVAMSLNKERLQILNLIPDADHAEIKITDLQDADGNGCGTRVEITFNFDTIFYEDH